MKQVLVYEDQESLARTAADQFVELAEKSIADRSRFSVALAGGSTPRDLYGLLASEDYRDALDWDRVHLFWGDERCVPPEHPDSNYGMVHETLLEYIPIPDENLHRMRGEINPADAAAAYHREMDEYFQPEGAELPTFDLVLLGLGYDGHTASLFPGSPAFKEKERWVVKVEHTEPPLPLVTRLTLSLPVLNAARDVIFLASGESKADPVSRVFNDDSSLPAAMVTPLNGNLTWLLDRAAAARIK